MQVVYTVPYRMNPILRFILRTCLILLCIGAVVFTTIRFVGAYREARKHPASHHKYQVQKPIITPWR